MEDVPKDRIQNVDNAASEVMEKCLTNKIVVNKILQHFPDRQLLDELSFVNKMWNYEARNVMRKRGNLYARSSSFLHYKSDQCEQFKDFQLDLQRMNVLPFDEIHISLIYIRQNCSCPTVGLEPTLEATLKRLTLKHFSLDMKGAWGEHENCRAMRFIKRVFHHFSPVLETLYLSIQDEAGAFIPNIIQHHSFPRLKVINLNTKYMDQFYISTNLAKPLLSRALNLQEFHFRGNINQIRQLSEGSSAVLVYRERVKAPFNEISDNTIGALRLGRVKLAYTGPEFNFERFNRIAPILLQICCSTTLRVVEVDALLAVPLMTYGVCFQNVYSLDMLINYDQLELHEPRILRIVKDFDFTRIFPSLENVKVDHSHPRLEMEPDGFTFRTIYPQLDLEPGHMNTIVEEATAVLREPLPDRAMNIKELILRAGNSHVNTQFFAEMFPNTRRLWLGSYSEAVPFGSIWKHWSDLEEIRVKGKNTGNLDSVFCGIFPEEVAELEQMDDEYLKRVNIVPVMPAITCLRNLRALFICLEPPPFQDSTSLFSNVTRLIAFRDLLVNGDGDDASDQLYDL